MTRLRFGDVWVDVTTRSGALAALEGLVDAKRGGAVFTPNVDHVVLASRRPEFRAAYARADLSCADGMPLIWSSRLLGQRLPEKVSGSDLFVPVLELAARRELRVYLFGGPPGVAESAAAKMRSELGVNVAGVECPMVGLEASAQDGEVAARMSAAKSDLVFVFLGAPKGELLIERIRERVAPAVLLSLGASVDFYVGRVKRAPLWMQRSGLEWLYRLLQEPRRLARRYLVDDPTFLGILLRTLRRPRGERVRG